MFQEALEEQALLQRLAAGGMLTTSLPAPRDSPTAAGQARQELAAGTEQQQPDGGPIFSPHY